MIKRLAALVAMTLTAGCVQLGISEVTPEEREAMRADALLADIRRGWSAAVQDAPFEGGQAISVVATEHGILRTYRLVPCRGGTAVCGGSANGPAGRVERTPDYVIVRGLYGRAFYLSPGGDGGIREAGHPDIFLAWDYAG